MANQSKRRKLPRRSPRLLSKVEKIVPGVHPSQPEKLQIEVEGADHLYSAIRLENTLTDGSGQEVKMKEGAHVDVTIKPIPHRQPRRRTERISDLSGCSLIDLD